MAYYSDEFQFIVSENNLWVKDNNKEMVICITDWGNCDDNMVELMNILKIGMKKTEELKIKNSPVPKPPIKKNPFKRLEFPDMRA